MHVVHVLFISQPVIFIFSLIIIVPSRSPLVLSGGVSMNVADQLASARRKCKHLLIHLFKMVSSHD